jgi:hypothetical protein
LPRLGSTRESEHIPGTRRRDRSDSARLPMRDSWIVAAVVLAWQACPRQMLPDGAEHRRRDYLCVGSCPLARLPFLSATAYACTTSQVRIGMAILGVSRLDRVDVRATVGPPTSRRPALRHPQSGRSGLPQQFLLSNIGDADLAHVRIGRVSVIRSLKRPIPPGKVCLKKPSTLFVHDLDLSTLEFYCQPPARAALPRYPRQSCPSLSYLAH